MPFKPYFYVATKKNMEAEMLAYLQKKYPKILGIEIVKKEDLDLVSGNHHFLFNFRDYRYSSRFQVRKQQFSSFYGIHILIAVLFD